MIQNVVINQLTREKVRNDILNLDNKKILVELPTGFGKSKIALDWLNKYYIKGNSILIVVPTNNLKINWASEIGKWNYNELLKDITFTTYHSLPKYINKQDWSIVIYDEAHHLTSRCIDAIENSNYSIDRTILLSATVSVTKKMEFKVLWNDLFNYKIKLKEAIDASILPDPTIILIPLYLDNIKKSCTITKRRNNTSYPATPLQFYNDISGLIEWYKRKHMENRMLRASLDRLIWLSEQKEIYTERILKELRNYRTLTFCSTIKQTQKLGKYCINSKNKVVQEYIELFNNKKIKHITACQMLNEGANLTACQVGIFNMLNSSHLMQIQKCGRILRHKKPIIILPYFKNTVEERNVQNMINNYNPQLVKTLKINEIINELK